MGANQSVPPCHTPAKWTAPPACEYIYNPVLHTTGAVVGFIILSSIGVSVIFLLAMKLVKFLVPKCKKSRNGRITKLFMQAGYTMANFARKTFSTAADFFDEASDDFANNSDAARTSYDTYRSTSQRRTSEGRTIYLDQSYQSNV